MKPRDYLLALVMCCCLVTASGCGPYRVRFQRTTYVPKDPYATKKHAHGMGLVGGGAYFFILHQLFPALVDYTGPVEVDGGFSEVSHYHSFGQNATAAFFSWLTLLNLYHESTIEMR